MDGTVVQIDDQYNIINFINKKAFSYRDAETYYKTVNIYKFSKEFAKQKYIPFLNAYCEAQGNNEYYEQVLRVIAFLNSQDVKALPIGNKNGTKLMIFKIRILQKQFLPTMMTNNLQK